MTWPVHKYAIGTVVKYYYHGSYVEGRVTGYDCQDRLIIDETRSIHLACVHPSKPNQQPERRIKVPGE